MTGPELLHAINVIDVTETVGAFRYGNVLIVDEENRVQDIVYPLESGREAQAIAVAELDRRYGKVKDHMREER